MYSLDYRRLWLIIIALVIILAFAFQGSRGLWEPDEGRYVRCAYEMLKSGDWLKIEIEPSDVEMIVPRLGEKDVKIRGTSGQDQVTALHVALALEKRAHDFYANQGRHTGDRKARDMYLRLAEMEEAHYELIQAEIDAIGNTGFWLGLREFSLEIE